MEEKVNPWKANLTNGLILGLAGVVFTLILWFTDMTFNKSMGYIFMGISVFLLYYLIRTYRDNYRHGYITYGQSVGAGVIIWLYYAIIAAVFTYILYKFIDPQLTDKLIAFSEEQLRKSGRVPENAVDAAMSMQKKFLKPEIMAPASIINNMIFGTIIALIVSIFTKKEGNPLIDNNLNQ
ncbi:MAG TPA: DUF4199 domain-containing protein [Bacteroidales bacterium]|nr:DUF4199 domain-containing protein [Bacteroidales bacterium]